MRPTALVGWFLAAPLRNLSDTYVVRAAATSAAAVAKLAGRPLRRGGVGVLPLPRHGGNGTEHL